VTRANGLRLILLVVAIVCFLLAAFAVAIDVNLIALGLAFFAGAFLAD
jgi:hypothetical protein